MTPKRTEYSISEAPELFRHRRRMNIYFLQGVRVNLPTAVPVSMPTHLYDSSCCRLDTDCQSPLEFSTTTEGTETNVAPWPAANGRGNAGAARRARVGHHAYLVADDEIGGLFTGACRAFGEYVMGARPKRHACASHCSPR